MSVLTAKRALPLEMLIPDCCNTGVIFRVLVAVNAIVFAAVLAGAGGVAAGVREFVESSIIVEPAAMASLIFLCGIRRAGHYLPSWAQRLACALVPMLVTAGIVQILADSGLLLFRSTDGLTAKMGLIAGLAGICLQHYFELRTRAFSPVLAEARLQALQARIRPHFLFNSLNAVLSLIRSEPRRAETTLEDLADLFRVLIRDARDLTSLDEEIRLCKQYLSIEKVRLGDRLQVQWKAVDISSSTLKKAQVPALLLQPLLENAVHYGVEPSAVPALVRIEVGRTLDRIEIAVVNPYHGEDRSGGGNQMALNNIRERLALLYDVEAQLTTTVTDGFYEVRLRFPYVRGAA